MNMSFTYNDDDLYEEKHYYNKDITNEDILRAPNPSNLENAAVGSTAILSLANLNIPLTTE